METLHGNADLLETLLSKIFTCYVAPFFQTGQAERRCSSSNTSSAQSLIGQQHHTMKPQIGSS